MPSKSHISPSESAGVIECSGSIALAKVLHGLKNETRSRIVGVTSANAAGIATIVLAGGLAEVQHAIEYVKSQGNENAIFFARPDKEAMSLLLKSLLLAEVEQASSLVSGESTKEPRVRDITDLHISEIETWNVHELRRYARSIESFPIKGRDISKANRSELLNLLQAGGYIYSGSPRAYPPANMLPS